MLTRYFDILLLLIAIFELIRKKVNMINTFDGKINRYVSLPTKLHVIIPRILLIVIGMFYLYRFYLIVIYKSLYTPSNLSIFMVLPLWLVLRYIWIRGIYYNENKLYVRYKVIDFSDLVYSYRFLDENNFYRYDISCDVLTRKGFKSVERYEFNFKILNENKAKDILEIIPYKER